MSAPLTRALTALQSVHAPRTDLVSVAFREEGRDALLEAQRERAAFVAVVRTGRALIEALDQYEAAPVGNVKRVVKLAAEIEVAEDPFIEALNRVPGDLGPVGQPRGEEAFLVALDHLSDEEGEDEQGPVGADLGEEVARDRGEEQHRDGDDAAADPVREHPRR